MVLRAPGEPPYWPWLQCIRAYVETVESGLLRQDMWPGAADISEILPELTGRLEELERPPALEPEQSRFRLFFSITTFLKNIRRSQPLVLVLDDLHRADESSLLLLEFLAREIAATSIMAIGVDRVLGLLARTMENTAQAAAHFEDALAFCHRTGYRPELAWTC